MENISEVRNKIAAIVIGKIDAGQPVSMAWITQEMLTEYSDIEGSDADFYIVCARHFINDAAKREIQKYEPKPDASSQLVMDGFEYLQKAYPMDRDGDRTLVPVDLITDDEFRARAAQYRSQADALQKHALEIEVFVERRNSDLYLDKAKDYRLAAAKLQEHASAMQDYIDGKIN